MVNRNIERDERAVRLVLEELMNGPARGKRVFFERIGDEPVNRSAVAFLIEEKCILRDVEEIITDNGDTFTRFDYYVTDVGVRLLYLLAYRPDDNVIYLRSVPRLIRRMITPGFLGEDDRPSCYFDRSENRFIVRVAWDNRLAVRISIEQKKNIIMEPFKRPKRKRSFKYI